MPCTNCKTDFNLLTWKLKCIECEQSHCSKCLKKNQGLLMCEKCTILNKRPPDRDKLMELKPKDLQTYLNRNHISTHGLVEKAELVALFYKKQIPTNRKRANSSFSSVFGGSVPNLATQTEERLHTVASNLETNLNNIRDYAEAAYNNITRLPENFFPSNNSSQPNSNSTNNTSGTNRRSSEQEIFRNASSSNQQNSTGYSQATSEMGSPSAPPAPAQHLKLSDFKAIEDIEALSVRQLKEVLTLNRVDYKGCVERNELLEKVIRLWIDSCTQNSDNNESGEDADNVCKICMDAPLECVILECGHIATCVGCGKQLAECPICRQFVTRVVRVFKA